MSVRGPWFDARDVAVRIVDQRHGYTVEHSPNPAAHLMEYDDEEARLTAADSHSEPQDSGASA